MKRYLRFVIVSAFMLIALSVQAQGLKVMSFNIRYSNGPDGPNSWPYRKDAVAAMINDQKPDVIGMQEVLPAQVKYLEKHCGQYAFVGVGRDDGKEKGERMMVYYNRKKFDMLDWHTYWLSETPWKPSRGWDAACKRTATWVKLQRRCDGKRFYFVDTHLDHMGEVAREKGLALIVDSIAAMNKEGYPMILVGDFNVEPENKCLVELNKRMKNARETAEKTDQTPSFHAWGYRPERIDYIYYRGFGRCMEYQVVKKKYKYSPYVSDHYPITALFDMSESQLNDRELSDPHPGDQSVWNSVKKTTLTWGTIDERYSRHQPVKGENTITLHAWRGERVAAQAVLSTPVEIESMKLQVSDLKCGKEVIPAEQIKKYFVRYVLGDLKEIKGDSMLSADRLESPESMRVEANTTRPVWLDVKVPGSAKAGVYKGTLTVRCDRQKLSLPFQVEVVDLLLPEPKDWTFHLDLWQNPYAVARYFNVPLWSEEHFNLMRPIMKRYADAGGKVITCSIIEHPWNSQTYDPFETMIVKMKQTDGTWKYDYTVFDRWVEFMMGIGVTQQIDCYTLVPWHYQFEYFDCATNKVKHIKCKPKDAQYREFLLPFLKDFARHLKEKGWFSRTCIAMDERPMDQLEAAWKVVSEADPGYRIEGAANYNIEQGSIGAKMYDISVGYRFNLFDKEVLKARKANGQKITIYTCCNPFLPNTFTLSRPAESAFLPWHTAAIGYDGYLRWALNSWSQHPCQDARFGNWLSGDAYLLYPEGTSIRFERLTEGIQQFEKIRILREKATPEQLAVLDAVLKKMAFTKAPNDFDFAAMIREANTVLKTIE